MSAEAALTQDAATSWRSDARTVRVFRYAVGSTLAVPLAMGIDWQLSFLAPILALSFLGTPAPRPAPKLMVTFIAIVAAASLFGVTVSALLLPYPIVFLLVEGLLLFLLFYHLARGAPALLVTWLMIALTVIPVMALQSMQLGQRLRLNQVVEFSSLGVYQLLGQLEDIPAVREFTQKVIGPLVDYDEQHRSSLVQTIDAYFKNHGNISQTAETLFIHRNTLLYRLDRIQDLTNHDLNQSNMRLALHLALKFRQLNSG